MQFRKIFKQLEVYQRILRQRVSPRAWIFVSRLKRRLVFTRKNESPTVLIDLKRTLADSDAGRGVALIFYYFKMSGFEIVVAPNHHFLASFRNKRYKKVLLVDPIFSIIPKNLRLLKVDIWIRDHPSRLNIKAKKLIELNYEARQPKRGDEVAMPYRIHPENLMNGGFGSVNKARGQQRSWRLFFAGNCDPKKYDKTEFLGPHGTLTRVALISSIKGFYGTKLTHFVDPNTPTQGVKKGFTTVDFKKHPVANEQWLQTLARAEFFVAAPGVHMPMSHNVVESMSVGTIPLLEYPNYFDPPLRHQVNCIAFHGIDGLHESLMLLDRLGAEEIKEMRQNVIRYFETYLSPNAAINLIWKNPREHFTLMWNSHRTPVTKLNQ